MRVRPAGAALLLAAAATATLHAPRAGGDAIELGRRGARGAGLAWVYHDGRIFRQNVDEDPVVVGRFLPDGAPARDEADSSVATAEECLQEANGGIRLVVDRDEVIIFIIIIMPFSPASRRWCIVTSAPPAAARRGRGPCVLTLRGLVRARVPTPFLLPSLLTPSRALAAAAGRSQAC
jgi:hypothetical protein